ncbi:MAG: MerR family transcriptional regulator, partial [Actinobacteria bacterium]|nr:MerR family transcriptional regulator [Actinomycetota bacterium]
ALRLYDERGLLVPSRVGQASGYRYYDTAQLDQARLEAFVALPDGPGDEAVHWHLAGESLEAWAQEQQHEGERLAFTPEDLGLRITFLASALGTDEPYRDMALPFRVAR